MLGLSMENNQETQHSNNHSMLGNNGSYHNFSVSSASTSAEVIIVADSTDLPTTTVSTDLPSTDTPAYRYCKIIFLKLS